MDVDGVLTDAGMYYTEHGDELKKFNTRDGMGVALVREAGLKTAILTRESTKLVERRGAKMRIDHVFIGVTDKLTCMRELLERARADAGAGRLHRRRRERLRAAAATSGWRRPSATPAACRNRLPTIITEAKGGEGAVRELCEMILEAQQEHPPLPEA